MVALSIAKSVRRLKHNALSLALGDWQRATRASLRGKVPLLQTAFEIERVALIKGTASSADDVWQAQISHGGRSQYLGSFATEEEAARAYDCAAARSHRRKRPSLSKTTTAARHVDGGQGEED